MTSDPNEGLAYFWRQSGQGSYTAIDASGEVCAEVVLDVGPYVAVAGGAAAYGGVVRIWDARDFDYELTIELDPTVDDEGAATHLPLIVTSLQVLSRFEDGPRIGARTVQDAAIGTVIRRAVRMLRFASESWSIGMDLAEHDLPTAGALLAAEQPEPGRSDRSLELEIVVAADRDAEPGELHALTAARLAEAGFSHSDRQVRRLRELAAAEGRIELRRRGRPTKSGPT